MADYYDTLGVTRGASEKDIRSAFRKLARKHHPDVNDNDPASEEKFKEINEAYTVLSDADSRRKYDRYGDDWERAGQFGQAGRRGGFSYSNMGGMGGGVRGFNLEDVAGEADLDELYALLEEIQVLRDEAVGLEPRSQGGSRDKRR